MRKRRFEDRPEVVVMGFEDEGVREKYLEIAHKYITIFLIGVVFFFFFFLSSE